MKVAIACDHGGFELKEELTPFLKEELGIEVTDFGVYNTDSVDYPDLAAKAAEAVQQKVADFGIVICGTGIGISIAANKHKGIRCALCHDCYSARVTREHNDSNMIAMGARVIGVDLAKEILRAFFKAEFEGDRHIQRIAKITAIEEAQL